MQSQLLALAALVALCSVSSQALKCQKFNETEGETCAEKQDACFVPKGAEKLNVIEAVGCSSKAICRDAYGFDLNETSEHCRSIGEVQKTLAKSTDAKVVKIDEVVVTENKDLQLCCCFEDMCKASAAAHLASYALWLLGMVGLGLGFGFWVE